MLGLARTCRAVVSRGVPTRQLHVTTIASMPRVSSPARAQLPVELEDLSETLEEMPVVEQLWVEQQRKLLYYMRLIEHELPQLVGKSFNSRNLALQT